MGGGSSISSIGNSYEDEHTIKTDDNDSGGGVDYDDDDNNEENFCVGGSFHQF